MSPILVLLPRDRANPRIWRRHIVPTTCSATAIADPRLLAKSFTLPDLLGRKNRSNPRTDSKQRDSCCRRTLRPVLSLTPSKALTNTPCTTLTPRRSYPCYDAGSSSRLLLPFRRDSPTPVRAKSSSKTLYPGAFHTSTCAGRVADGFIDYSGCGSLRITVQPLHDGVTNGGFRHHHQRRHDC